MGLTSRLLKSKFARNALTLGALATATIPTTSCVTVTRQEKATIRELEMYGVDPQDKKVVDPGLAGFLNIGPGLGNFYLAIGGDESSQYTVGALNFLLWYLSPVWGIPEAVIDAGRINKKATAYHYTEGPGKFTLEKLREEYRKKFEPKTEK